MRLKKYVFKPEEKKDEESKRQGYIATIKLPQMEASFKGNEYLEGILANKRGLDWRLFTRSGIFLVNSDIEEEGRDLDSMDEDPDLTFNVMNLMLLGCLYCRSSPRNR